MPHCSSPRTDRGPALSTALGIATSLLLVGAAPAFAAPTWLSPETHAAPVASSVEDVIPALSSGGDIALLYAREGSGGGRQEELRLRPFGAAWGNPQVLGDASSSAVTSGTLSIADDGAALASWSRSSQGIWAATREAGTATAATPVKVDSGSLSTSPLAVSASNRDGAAAVAWIKGTNFTTDRTVVVRVRAKGQTSFGAEIPLTRITDGNLDEYGEPVPGARPERGPYVAVAPDGTVVVAWSQTDTKVHSGTRAYTAVLRPG